MTENGHSCLLRSKGSDCRIFLFSVRFPIGISEGHAVKLYYVAQSTSSFVQIVVAPQEAPFRWPETEDRSRRRLFFRRNPLLENLPRGISAHTGRKTRCVGIQHYKAAVLIHELFAGRENRKAFPQAATLPSRTSPVGGRVENYAVIYIPRRISLFTNFMQSSTSHRTGLSDRREI